jgi:hypothetical protein
MEPVAKLRFDRATSTARMTLEGPQSPAAHVKALEAAAKSSEYQSATRRLWDIRQTDVRALEFRSLSAVREHLVALGGRAARVAIVARTDLQFGLAREFQALADGRVPSTIEVFRGVEEAEAWLAAPAPTE